MSEVMMQSGQFLVEQLLWLNNWTVSILALGCVTHMNYEVYHLTYSYMCAPLLICFLVRFACFIRL